MILCDSYKPLVNYPILPHKPNWYWFTVVLLVIFSSCNHHLPNTHEKLDKYTDSLSHHLFQSHQEEASFKFVDSVYNIASNRSIVGLHLKYRWKMMACNYRSGGAITICESTYADSIISMLETEHKETEFAAMYAMAYFSKGDYYSITDNFKAAFDYFFKGLKIAEKNALSACILSQFYYRMGRLYYKQAKYNDAKNCYIQQADNAANCTDDWQRFVFSQECLSNIAECYIKVGKLDSAIVAAKKSVNYITRYRAEHDYKESKRVNYYYAALSVVYADLGDVYAKKKQVDSAEQYLKKSIAYIDISNSDRQFAQKTRLELSKLYLQTHQRDKAAVWLNDVKASLDTLPSADVMVDHHYQQYDYYNKLNQPAKALVYLQQYYAARDSAIQQEKTLANTNIDARLTEASHKYDIELLTKDNALKKSSIRFTVIALALSVALVVLMFWAYGRKRKIANQLTNLNKEINHQKLALEKAAREKDKILRVVVHDLRSPLSAIATVTENMLQDGGTEEPNTQRLQLVNKASISTLHMIDELLEENRKKEKTALVKQNTDIKLLLQQCTALFEMALQQKRISLQLNLPTKPVIAYIHAEKMARVISNLISNAIKFCQPMATITIGLKTTATNLLISVADTGIGIVESELPKVFNSFTNAKRTGTDGEKSFGLGLSICKEITEAHGGTIWAESIENKGTTVFVKLPFEAGDGA